MAPQKIGRYEVKSELGRGGMATVFLAEDPLIGREIAVKVLPREFLHDPSFRGRFQREARTVAMLEHPAIVPIYDFGEQDGQPYLVMRVMKGGTLGDRIKDGPLAPKEAAEILRRLGSALDHAHSRGVVHRDLKPGNILFDETGNAFLSDFGIVKLAQSTATLTGESIVGTPAYMSPEQVHGDKEIDGRSDIYTLGVILFQMLTGQMPYHADTPAKLMMAHVLNPVPRVLDVRPDLPAAANDVLAKALAKSPDERFSTAAELTNALEDTLQGRSPLQATVLDVPAPETGARTSAAQASATHGAAAQESLPSYGSGTAQAQPAGAPEPKAATGGNRRILMGVVGLLGVLALCCGGFFIYSFIINGESPLVDADATATAQALVLVGDGTLAGATPESTEAPDVTNTPDQAATDAAVQDATSTAEAQEGAIATRVAESTVTAEARLTQTSEASAPTREVERVIQLVLDAQNNDPLFGPQSGSLEHISDGFVKAYYAELDVRDFVVDAVFFNPYAASRGDWDIGYSLREVEINDQFRIAVESNGDWSLADHRGEDTTYIHEGFLNNLNTGEGEGNRLTVFMSGDVGYFFVNGQYVAELDLSARSESGDVGVATSLFEGYEIEGEATGFDEFTVWPLQ